MDDPNALPSTKLVQILYRPDRVRNLVSLFIIVFSMGYVLLQWNGVTPAQMEGWKGLGFLMEIYGAHLTDLPGAIPTR